MNNDEVQVRIPYSNCSQVLCSGFLDPSCIPNQFGGHSAYFRVDNSFKWADTMDVLVILDYFDAAPGQLSLEFDGSDPQAPFQGAYTASPVVVALSGSRTWRKAVFTLDRARFRNSQNGGADFRLGSSVSGFAIERVQLVRPGLEAGGFTATNGFRLTLFGAPDYNVALETSTNLTNWTELTQVQLSGTSMPYTDTGATQNLWRWYRARPR